MTLIEGHVTRLRLAAVASLTSNDPLLYFHLTSAVRDLQSAVDDLYSTPRLSDHLWLNSIRDLSPRARHLFSSHFVGEFVSLIDKLETLETNLLVL